MHLTEAEVARLKVAALRINHYGFRDAAMVSCAFRHGLRVRELVDLLWTDVDFEAGKLHVRRVKGSAPSTHMLQGDELRALRRLKRAQQPPSPFIFTTIGSVANVAYAPCSSWNGRRRLKRGGRRRGAASRSSCWPGSGAGAVIRTGRRREC